MDLREIPNGLVARHPWETARATFFARVLETRAGEAPVRVLDVGAGDGYVARTLLTRLATGSTVVCFDSAYLPRHLEELGADRRSGLAFTREPPTGRFDAVLLLDVLEHVEDDRAWLRSTVETFLADEGVALISVPAFMSLYTRHDVELGHHRRYRPAQLRALLESAGLAMEAGGGLFHSLLVPRAASKVLELARGVRSSPSAVQPPDRAETATSRWNAPRAVTGLVQSALALDNALSATLSRWAIPVPGLSTWALATRDRA